MTDPTIDALIDFWLGPLDDPEAFPREKEARWWRKDAAFDATCRAHYLNDLERLAAGECEAWRASARGSLAYVILADQLSRNIFRGTARAFALDERALATALGALESGQYAELHPAGRALLHMPLEHAEDLALQDRCVALCQALAEATPEAMRDRLDAYVGYARRHRDIVARFGRFPHRNAVLGRASTDEEAAFLEQPGSSF